MIPLLEIWYATIMHFSFRCIQSEDQYLLSVDSDTTSVKIKVLRLKCDLFWVRKNWCHSWKIITYSWVPNRRPPRPCQLNFWFSSVQDIFTPTPDPPHKKEDPHSRCIYDIYVLLIVVLLYVWSSDVENALPQITW